MFEKRAVQATAVATVAFLGLALPAHAQTNITNAAPIAINDLATAAPYPSTIFVEGLKHNIAHLSVTLHGFSHTFPEDVGVLLVGPAGQSLVLMGRCGGGGPGVSNATYTFDDLAAGGMGDTPTGSGTYRPSDCNPGIHNFAGPAPSPNANTLSAFNGTNGNGAWSLYVQDFAFADSGSISGGWTLSITEAGALGGGARRRHHDQ